MLQNNNKRNLECNNYLRQVNKAEVFLIFCSWKLWCLIIVCHYDSLEHFIIKKWESSFKRTFRQKTWRTSPPRSGWTWITAHTAVRDSPHSQNPHGFTPTIPQGRRWHVAMAALFDSCHEDTEVMALTREHWHLPNRCESSDLFLHVFTSIMIQTEQ